MLFSSPWRGHTRLYATQLRKRAGAPVALTGDGVSVQDFDEANGVIVAAASTPENPAELYLIDPGPGGGVSEGGASMRRLTDLNARWVAERELARATEHWITRDDGARVQYWVMPPTGARPGEKYPVVLEMHGGPMAMWGPSEQTMWHEFQLLCSWGYGVVYCNPRGSSGYGYDFQKGNFQNWGAGPAADVLAAFDDAARNNAWIDTERAFLTGGSYAGYLTAWIIAHDHRFKAAVAQRGVYDLETFFGEGNAWILVKEAFGGFPWEPETAAVLKRESPFTYVDRITTPFLIIHSSSDLRTGVTQSEMMYRALKELNRPVEYVRYPGAGHDLSRTGDPKQRMDRLLRIVEFFERFAGNERPAPTIGAR